MNTTTKEPSSPSHPLAALHAQLAKDRESLSAAEAASADAQKHLTELRTLHSEAVSRAEATRSELEAARREVAEATRQQGVLTQARDEAAENLRAAERDLAAMERACGIAGAPVEAAIPVGDAEPSGFGSELSRAAFDRLPHHERSAFIAQGGKLTP